jgi:outer membrane protein assembly factor BamB
MAGILRAWLVVALIGVMAEPAWAENWPSWRGPRGDGSSHETNVPMRWNGATGENISWKTELPGWGHSSPIVWEDAVFVTACDDADQTRLLLSLDARTGKTRWETRVLTAPLEKRHKLNSLASGTPATDGQRVYVTFLEPDFGSLTERTPGNMVVAAYDYHGQLCWAVRPGRFASVHGYCSSPILYENMVIVNGDHDGDGYLVALDRTNGDEIWRIARRHNTRSYCTPIIRRIGDRLQMVLSGSMHVASYDPRDGSEHWYIEGPTEQFVASLVFNGSLLFLTAGYPEHHILAIRPDGYGNVTDSHIVWRTTRGCSYVPSPITLDEYFLVAADIGVVSCYQANAGKLLWRRRLGSHYSASLVSAEGHVYFLADDGTMKVVRPGSELNILAENPLGEYCYASPAISNQRIYLRGERHLYCVAEP